MQVNPSNNLEPVIGITRPRLVREVRNDQDQVAFDRSESLNRALAQTPQVREAEVARAKSLVEQSTYPPIGTIRRIANLLAMKLGSDIEA
ncbi:MAG: hypothetical protein M1608_09670 [Candidatus Omnitrophica bacterium]|nr:hypothetical protein [Candidatus Omnitrophota bacterium]